MAYDVGDIAVFTLGVAPHDGTTGATVVVRAPDGTETTPTPTPSGGGATWTVQVPLTAAGTWYVTWTVTGAGAGVQTDSADADPAPPPSDTHRQTRLLITDTDPANRLFSTLQLADFLAMNSGNIRRAAAQALDVLAANEALVSKVIKTKDLSTDGAKTADALRKQAAELRRQADAGEDITDDSTGFEIVEFEPSRCRRGWLY